MAGVQTSVQLTDLMSGPLQRITQNLDACIRNFEQLHNVSGDAINSNELAAARGQLEATNSILETIQRQTQQNESSQEQYNRSLGESDDHANILLGTLKKVAIAYGGIKGMGALINLSDEMSLIESRLRLINDGQQTMTELENMIYSAAQDTRVEYQAMANAVGKLGNQAKGLFDSTQQLVDFNKTLNMFFKVSGATADEQKNATMQLVQALGSGVLRGDELNSIFEQAPMLIQAIADYMGKPISAIREMAADGEISATIVKNAVFASAGEIESKFKQINLTWSDIWLSMKNTALIQTRPILQEINNLANNTAVQQMGTVLMGVFTELIMAILKCVEYASMFGSFIADNWSVIQPIVIGITTAMIGYYTALGIYNGIQLVTNTIQSASAAISAIHAARLAMQTGATFAATAAQYGFNTALMACPLTWILLIIIGVITAIYLVVAAINKWKGTHVSATGIICGSINVIIQFFKNLGLGVANVALGIWESLKVCCTNMVTAFSNGIKNVQGFFYNLMSTAMKVIESICQALNKLPFVEFDFSGITSAANEYANKSAEAYNSKGTYESVGDAWSKGVNTFDAYKSGWASDAYNAGYKVGENFSNGMESTVGKGVDELKKIANSNYVAPKTTAQQITTNTPTYNPSMSTAKNTNKTAKNTKDIKDSLDITSENLKYLKDLAETEIINRFTTAEIKIDMLNNNNISGTTDIDGIVDNLRTKLEEEMYSVAEGVHR